MFYNDFNYLTKKLKLSYCRYTHSGIRSRPKTGTNDKFAKKGYVSPDASPDLKADFPKHEEKTMKSTFHRCVVHVIPVTNPRPMDNPGKYKVK